MKAERIDGTEESITEEGLKGSASTLIPADRVLLVVRSGILKHTIPVAINTVSVCLNQDMKALAFDPSRCLPSFFLRWVQGHNDQLLLAWAKQGATVESIEHAYLVDQVVPMPGVDEQREIIEFLDRETAKIDALVAEQRRLIELLKEKRQAVISHAVTKGLNPNAPMKPSGMEWLGDVPAHWAVKRLKQISPQITVGIVVEPSKYYVTEGVPALRSMNVRPGQIADENMVYISEGANTLHNKSRIWEGDIVAVRSGQPGTSAIVPASLSGANCIDLIIIRKPTAGSERFLCWLLAGDHALRQFSTGSEGAIQQHFNVGTASNLIVTMPPQLEQDEIANFIDQETIKIDSLVAMAARAIDLMIERRAALISAAVTGQIDVRQSSELAGALR